MKGKPWVMIVFLCLALGAISSAAPRELVIWIVDWDTNLTPPVFENRIKPAFKAVCGDVALDIMFHSWTDYRDKLLIAAASGVGPDVFQVGGADTVWAVHNALCLPLTQFYARWPRAHELPEAIKENSYYQGEYWSVPTLAAPRSLLYLRSTFEAAGLDPARPPTTWEELQATARNLLCADGNQVTRIGLAVPSSGTATQEFWLPFLEQAGGQLVDAHGSPDFNTPAGLESLTFYASLYREQYSTGMTLPSGPSLANGGYGMEITNLVTTNSQIGSGVLDAADVVVALPTRREKHAATVFADPVMIGADTSHL